MRHSSAPFIPYVSSAVLPTPGPWRVDRGCIVTGNGPALRVIADVWTSCGTEQGHANAYLLAAAPALRTALESLVDVLDRAGPGGAVVGSDRLQAAVAALRMADWRRA